jgi:predicted DCC family thiol-disulfide oxidoreductase YuxK
MSTEPTILFDGYCNLCNSWVSFVIARDHKRRFRFATLQGARGHALVQGGDGLSAPLRESVVLVQNDRVYTRSGAALRIFAALGFPWSLFKVFLIVPRQLRDVVYDFVARNRYRWFGRRTECRVPRPEERTRFLE